MDNDFDDYVDLRKTFPNIADLIKKISNALSPVIDGAKTNELLIAMQSIHVAIIVSTLGNNMEDAPEIAEKVSDALKLNIIQHYKLKYERGSA